MCSQLYHSVVYLYVCIHDVLRTYCLLKGILVCGEECSPPLTVHWFTSEAKKTPGVPLQVAQLLQVFSQLDVCNNIFIKIAV